MADPSYAATYVARNTKHRRRRMPLRLLFILIVTAAAGVFLFEQFLTPTPKALQELLVRNPETADFVLGYADRNQFQDDIDLSGDVTPGQTPLFLQWDQRWGYAPYGGYGVENMIGLSGCGPTALSMVTVALTGELDWDPRAVADYAAANGHYSPGNGTAWSLMNEGCQALGLSSQEVPLHDGSMIAALDAGKLLIASVGPGDFTETGHFIVLCGWDGEAFEIRDPNSRANTEKTWTYETLSPQIRGLWAFSAP